MSIESSFFATAGLAKIVPKLQVVEGFVRLLHQKHIFVPDCPMFFLALKPDLMATRNECFALWRVPPYQRGMLGPRNPDEIFEPLTHITASVLSQAIADGLPPNLAGCTLHACGILRSKFLLPCDFLWQGSVILSDIIPFDKTANEKAPKIRLSRTNSTHEM